MLFPIANRPLLDWVLENLSKHGVKTVVLAVNYGADALLRYFRKTKFGMKILYSSENKPLGTGGPIRKAKDLLGDGEPFFVLNGDVLTSIDYAALYQFHKTHRAQGTIALHEVEDPSRFGVVEINKQNQIVNFFEKPKLEDAPSTLINAGVYVLDQSVIDLIPPENKTSIEREIFPILASRGHLYGQKIDDLWIDIGTPDDYLNANSAMLGIISREKPLIGNDVDISDDATIIPPTVIGNGVTIERDACIGPYSAIGDYVTVRGGSKITNSVVFPRAWIDASTSIKNAIIGESAILGRWVKIEEGCIVGDRVIINDDVTLAQVKVCPSKEVEGSIIQPQTVM
jgi:mannose-1-phosphate guanylyltransferase